MQFKSKPLFWTKDGLTALGRLIRLSRENQQLTLMDAVALIKQKTGQSVGFRTLASVETSVGEPKYNTLAAIAAAGFVKADGRTLDIFDFIAIASESEVNMNALAQLIQNYLDRNNTTLEEFARLCRLDVGKMRAIASGMQTADYETDIALIAGYLDNPTTGRKFAELDELFSYCGLRINSSGSWEESHIGNTNGVH
ncbi:hypothetical protein H6G36_25445 [Anabaena minutissima FACHB-250]|nr:hypothetical protein [Anabaena minutissima FACHB-250]